MRRRRESQISNSLTRQNNNFARASRFFVHFFAVNCTTTCVKMPNFTFVKDVNKPVNDKTHSLHELGYGTLIEIHLQKSSLACDKVNELP